MSSIPGLKEYVTTDISTPFLSLSKGEKLRFRAPKVTRDDFLRSTNNIIFKKQKMRFICDKQTLKLHFFLILSCWKLSKQYLPWSYSYFYLCLLFKLPNI